MEKRMENLKHIVWGLIWNVFWLIDVYVPWARHSAFLFLDYTLAAVFAFIYGRCVGPLVGSIIHFCSSVRAQRVWKKTCYHQIFIRLECVHLSKVIFHRPCAAIMCKCVAGTDRNPWTVLAAWTSLRRLTWEFVRIYIFPEVNFRWRLWVSQNYFNVFGRA